MAADGATLAHILRYPVKGMRGVDADCASLEQGHGLRFDRSFAIERGIIPVESPHGWNRRATYFHVARDPEILRIRTAMIDAEDDDNAVLTLSANDSSVDIRLNRRDFDLDRERADVWLRALLPSGPLGVPTLSPTPVGVWDWPDAHISLINLATIRALEAAAGAAVDPRRFRGNLYIDGGEPWSELGYLGKRIRLGDVTLEVFQPTNRCRATTIDPESSESNLNVPGLLASGFGYAYCGVYARVIEPGEIRRGDRVEVVRDGPDASLAGAKANWPRAANILETRRESRDVTSFWLDDPAGLVQKAAPGQHIRVSLPGMVAPAWRCYTVSGVREGAFRISVKRDGRVSKALSEYARNERGVILTGPAGEVTLNQAEVRDVVLLSAGIGITPTVAMLRHLVDLKHRHRVRVLHVGRRADEVPLWDEVLDARRLMPNVDVQLFLTQEETGMGMGAGPRSGRPDRSAFVTLLTGLNHEQLAVFVCGPGSFVSDARATLTGLGVPNEAIRSETFFSPTAATFLEPRPPSSPGPHSIRLRDQVLEWTPARGSILDTAESAGIALPSGCRAGACGTCEQHVVSGDLEYLIDPIAPIRPGMALICCSVPMGDVCLSDDS